MEAVELNSMMEVQGSRRFGPSERALKQRRWLYLVLKLVALACFGLLWWELSADSGLKDGIRLGALGLLAFGILSRPAAWFLAPLQQRSLTLHAQVLELSRGSFRRFVVFENLKHIQVWQSVDERLVAILLHTADDTVLLRDLEGLGAVFSALSQNKPSGVMIEVEERRIDWGEPLPWMLGLGLGVGLGVVGMF